MNTAESLSLLRAIEAEQRAIRRSSVLCSVYQVEPLPGPSGVDYAIVYLQPKPTPRTPHQSLDERFEGGTAVFGTDSRFDIASVDEQNSAIVVRLHGRPLPPNGGEVRLFEPDFLAGLLQWVRENVTQLALPAPPSQAPESGSEEPPPLALGSGRSLPQLPPKKAERVRIVWGPPGTGKTYHFGELLAKTWASGGRATAVTPTHVAADQLALATDGAMQRLGWRPEHGVVVRYGQRLVSSTIELPEHLGHEGPEVKELKRQAAHLRERLRDCRIRLSFLSTGSTDYHRTQYEIAELQEALRKMQEKMRDLVRQLLTEAPIVICTAHAFTSNREILARSDTLRLADEASMLPLAFVAPLTASGAQSLVFGGDFRQLDPICQAESDTDARRWFGRSIFHLFGLPGRETELKAQGVLTMLTEQRRMRAGICDFISRSFYHGLLTTVVNHEFVPALQGWPTTEFVWVDPNVEPNPYTPPTPSSDGGKSWGRSAERAAEWSRVALQLEDSLTVATITPWRAQERLLRSLLGPEIRKQRLKVGTVHKLQGQEADVVVFDVVDSQYGPLRHNPEEIVNVAVSRARKQVIVVASRDAIQRHPYLARMPLPATPLGRPPSFDLKKELPPPLDF